MRRVALVLSLLVLLGSNVGFAGEPEVVSPKEGWGDLEVVERDVSRPIWQQVLLWPVNRVVDIIDVFRFDVGIGPAAGATLRLTKQGQLGFRQMAPGSVRIGNFGRRVPFALEHSNELGAGPTFIESGTRDICQAELGGGIDLFILGAHIGICGEELIDLVGGVFFLDPSDDDIR